MNDLEQIVGQHINYSLEITSSLNRRIKDKDLTDYQFFTSRVFIGLKTLSSLLVFWDTGFGKTLLGLYVIKNINFIYPSWRIFVFVKASLHNIWEDGIKFYCNKRVEILHYDDINVFLKFKNKLENYKNKKDRILIIIDEVHNLILRNKERDLQYKERKIGRLFRLIRNITSERFNKLLLMSATPIVNDIKEFNLLIDLMRKGIMTFDERYFNNEKLINVNTLKNGLLSICSYRKVETDSLVNTDSNDHFASKKIFIHKILMSDYQGNLFNEAEKYEIKNLDLYNLRTIRKMVSTFVFHGLKIKEGMSDQDYNNLIQEKLASFRKSIQNIKISEDVKTMLINNNDSSITDDNFLTLYDYSCKYITTCKLILQSRGKCLIYEPFVSFEGITTLKEYLNLFNISHIEYSKFSSTRQSKLNEFNKDANKDGDIIKCCIITNAGSEGVSFTCINDLIVLDIPWSESQLRQIIGRSLRYNSHIKTSRNYVNIHILIAFTKTGKSSDNELLSIINRKLKRINQVYSLLKDTSIETLYTKYKDQVPIDIEYIFDNLQKNKIDFNKESNFFEVKYLSKIKFITNKGIIEDGFLDSETKLIYDKNMALVGKVKEINGHYDIYIQEKNIVYNIE